MTNRVGNWAALALIAVLAAGCAGTPPAVSPPVGGVASTPAPSPDASAAAAQYLAAAAKANAALTAAAKAFPSAPTLEQAKAAYAQFATIDNAFESDLLAIKFPARMSDDVKGMIRALASEISISSAIASASSIAEVNLHINDLTKVRGDLAAAIDIVRSDLALPRSSG